MKKPHARPLVVHRRHTGRILPRPATSYPLLAMILLLVGVLISSWSGVVSASFPGPVTNAYTVSTRYPAPLPTVPATINGPLDGQQFNQEPITVTGSCPQNSYVELLRNGFFSGVAICDASGNYQLQTDLFKGANKLVPQVYNITDDAGPVGAATTVYYQPPASPLVSSAASTGSNTGTTSQATPPATPLLLKTNFNYQGYYAGQTTQWQLEVSGGSGPYAISADWGDGSRDLLSLAQPGSFVLQHTFKKAGGYHGSYVVKISASDNSGNQNMVQLLAIINTPNPKTAANLQVCLNNCSATSQAVSSTIRRVAWSGYGVCILMLASFWLGERYEIQFLRAHRKKLRHT